LLDTFGKLSELDSSHYQSNGPSNLSHSHGSNLMSAPTLRRESGGMSRSHTTPNQSTLVAQPIVPLNVNPNKFVRANTVLKKENTIGLDRENSREIRRENSLKFQNQENNLAKDGDGSDR
jgi:hypothetical protein